MSKAQSTDYPGNPLKFDDSFRLLELQPGQKSDPVVVRLLDCTLGNHPKYEAVSYTWGDLSLVTNINVSLANFEDQVPPVSATINCQAALRCLRQPDEARLLWIDAICINQGLIKERNHQLDIMGKIYKNASRVVIYLGETADDSDIVMDWIEGLDDAIDYGESETHRPPAPEKGSIQALLSRPWFHRVWVLQEIHFGSDPVVVCGDRSLSWTAFCGVRHAIIDGGSFVKIPYSFNYPREDPSFEYDWNFVPYAHRLMKMLRSSRHCGATDPRDKIYAILPLLEMEHETMISALDQRTGNPEDKILENLDLEALRKRLKIQPDYDLPVAEVYTETTKEIMEILGAQIILQSVQSPRIVPGLPSWVPDWSAAVAGIKRDLRGFPYFNDSDYKVWRKDDPLPAKTWRLSNYTLPGGGLSSQLHLQAANLGSITNLGDVCDVEKNVVPIFDWWDMAKDPENPEELCSDDTDSPPTKKSWRQLARDPAKQSKQLRQFWKTMGTDRHWESRIEPLVLAMVNRYVRHVNMDQDLPRWGKEKSDPEPTSLKQAIDDWPYNSITIRARMIFQICDKQRFFVTDTGHMGLVPGDLDVKVGDCLHVAEEWGIPFVFRSYSVSSLAIRGEEFVDIVEAQPPESGEPDAIFTLQGEAYVQKPWMWEEKPVNDQLKKIKEIIVR